MSKRLTQRQIFGIFKEAQSGGSGPGGLVESWCWKVSMRQIGDSNAITERPIESIVI